MGNKKKRAKKTNSPAPQEPKVQENINLNKKETQMENKKPQKQPTDKQKESKMENVESSAEQQLNDLGANEKKPQDEKIIQQAEQAKEEMKEFNKKIDEANEELVAKSESQSEFLPTHRTTVDNIVIGVGLATTIAAVVGLVVFYATAGLGWKVALVLFAIDSAIVLFFGLAATYLAYIVKNMISDMYHEIKASTDAKKESKKPDVETTAKEVNTEKSSGGQPVPATA